jgi:hypothetical protein
MTRQTPLFWFASIDTVQETKRMMNTDLPYNLSNVHQAYKLLPNFVPARALAILYVLTTPPSGIPSLV